jgi:hypothetical protein
MALETGTYVSDLVTTNPSAGDPLSQADDHLRLLKATLQNTFPEGSAPIYGLRMGTPQASTSGVSIDFTSVPSWVRRITICFVGVSVSGTSNPVIQIGDSGGVEATGYLGSSAGGGNGVSPGVVSYTTGYGINSADAAAVLHGAIVLTLVNSTTNTWTAHGTLGSSNTAGFFTVAGSKSLSATLDRVRITTVGGVNTFDAGSINIQYD